MKNPYGQHRTRFPELNFSRVSPREWSFYAVDNGAPLWCRYSRVGPLYATSAELLADLPRYAREYGLSP